MRTCYQILRHKLKSVVVLAPQAEERRGKCTWRTMKKRCDTECAICPTSFAAAPVLLHCVDNLAPQAEERRCQTQVEASSELVPDAEERDVLLDAEPGTTS